MKKKIIMCAVILISLALSAFVGVVRFSDDNISNRKENRTELYMSTQEDMNFSDGWQYSGKENSYTTETENSKITFTKPIDIYVSNIRFDSASIEDVDEIEPRVYYTENADEIFSEEKNFIAPVSVKNGDVYFKIDKQVYNMQIELYGESEKELSLKGIEFNPRKINVNAISLLLLFVIPVTLIWFIVETLSDVDEFKKDIRSMKRYKYLLYDLVTRDIKTKYRRSALGILWSVLNPLLMMLVLTAVFSNLFRFNIEDFPIYYLTGYIMFNFFQESTNFSLTSIINASGLIKKVYIPKFIFPLEKCLFSFVNMLFSLIAVVIVFLILGIQPHITMLLFFVPMIYIFFFSLGVSFIVATLNTFFRDVGHLYGILVMVWMYITPIIYPIEILPQWMLTIVKLNPLYYYVEYFRNVMIRGIWPSFTDNLICLSFSVVVFIIGFVIFRKKQDKFILFI